jgi:hypothetical protein
MKMALLFSLGFPLACIAADGQADRPAHQWFSVYQSGKTNWFNAVAPIVQATNGIPDLIRELSCGDDRHRDLAGQVLRGVYSEGPRLVPGIPTNAAAWSAWWEKNGRTNSVQTLWHNFDSHYK